MSHLGTDCPDVPTLVQALHSPEEVELEKAELDFWEVEVLENWPLASGVATDPEVDTVTAGPW